MAEENASQRYEEASRHLETFAKTPRPVVFQFQPERFELVTGNQLQEWERLMATRVNLQVNTEGVSFLPSISYCGPSPEDACDCDAV